MRDITITMEEGQRQMTLLALAELAIARPGWVDALERVALLMDNHTATGNAELFRKFLDLHVPPEGRKVT
jgi:hypothetical protein